MVASEHSEISILLLPQRFANCQLAYIGFWKPSKACLRSASVIDVAWCKCICNISRGLLRQRHFRHCSTLVVASTALNKCPASRTVSRMTFSNLWSPWIEVQSRLLSDLRLLFSAKLLFPNLLMQIWCKTNHYHHVCVALMAQLESLRVILADLGLSDYYDSLTTEGFDDWSTICDIKEADLWVLFSMFPNQLTLSA